MTIRKRNDAEGWKRGVGNYSDNYAKFDHTQDSKAVKAFGDKIDATSGNGAPGPVSRGGPPRYKVKTGPLTNGGN